MHVYQIQDSTHFHQDLFMFVCPFIFLTKVHTLFRFPQFQLIFFFFWSRIPSRISHDIYSSCLLRLLLFLFFDDLDILKECLPDILLTIPKMRFSDVSVMVRLGFEEKTSEDSAILCYYHNTDKQTYHQHDLSLLIFIFITWLR